MPKVQPQNRSRWGIRVVLKQDFDIEKLEDRRLRHFGGLGTSDLQCDSRFYAPSCRSWASSSTARRWVESELVAGRHDGGFPDQQKPRGGEEEDSTGDIKAPGVGVMGKIFVYGIFPLHRKPAYVVGVWR